MKRARIGITMGDPAGVGPEVVMKALAHPATYETARPIVIGDAKRLEQAAAIARLALDVRAVAEPELGADINRDLRAAVGRLATVGLAFAPLVHGERPGRFVPGRLQRAESCAAFQRALRQQSVGAHQAAQCEGGDGKDDAGMTHWAHWRHR